MNVFPAALILVTALAMAPGAPARAPVTAAAEPLADSAVLARVADRVITVGRFRDLYQLADATTRPGQDSTGRAEFLSSLIDKEVLGLTAVGIATPLRFEDRLELREYENGLLAATFYDRRVVDPVVLKTADLKQVYQQYSYALRLRHLLLRDRETAERVRRELVSGRLAWSEAARQYAAENDTLAREGSEWLQRSEMSGKGATAIFELKPPQISEVFTDVEGYHIWQCLDRRQVEPPTYLGVRLAIAQQLRAARQAPLEEKFFEEVQARAQARYDTTNIAWLADLFRRANPPSAPNSRPVIDLTFQVPRLAPADTGRVLAVVHGIPFSAGHLMSRYRQVPGLMRRKIQNFAALFDIVNRMVLEDDIVALARDQGFERDPEVVRKMDNRREGLLVDRMYSDSVLTQVRVTENQRRQAFEQYRNKLTVPGRARFAYIIRRTEVGADSVLAQLAGGMPAEMIVLADSMAGMRYGATRELGEEEASGYHDILFGELKPGKATKAPLGDAWVVLHLYDRTEGRNQSYEEALPTVDEVVQSSEAERILKSWLRRLRARYPVESHPEWVMRLSMIPKTPERVLPSE